MEIHIDRHIDGMVRAWRDGTTGYTPIFQGKPMAVECCSPEASLKNLRTLLKAGLKVRDLTTGPNNSLHVLFETGEAYLATGFGVGYAGVPVTALAYFASEALGGSIKEWICYLEGLPTDYCGPLSALRDHTEPKLFEST